MLKSVLVLPAALLLSPACLAADQCETLRAQIEANIAAKGISGFSVRTVEAQADVPGQVVGTCGQGARKIVYARSGSAAGTGSLPAAASRAPAATPRATRDEAILTECRDGTVSMGGRCKD